MAQRSPSDYQSLKPGGLSDHKMSQRKRYRLDGMNIFAVKEKQVKGRQGDQRYRRDPEHDGVYLRLPQVAAS